MELYIFALMSSIWFQINDKFASDNIRYFLRYAWTSAVIIVENRSFYVHGHDIPWSRTSTKWLNGEQMTHCMNDTNRINGPFEPNKKDDYNHTKKNSTVTTNIMFLVNVYNNRTKLQHTKLWCFIQKNKNDGATTTTKANFNKKK